MKYVDVDLDKQTITRCVVDQTRARLDRSCRLCEDESGIERSIVSAMP